jgi:hypothetical protein
MIAIALMTSSTGRTHVDVRTNHEQMEDAMTNGPTKNDLDAALELLRRLVYIDMTQDVDTQMRVAADDARRFLARIESIDAGRD